MDFYDCAHTFVVGENALFGIFIVYSSQPTKHN